MTANAFKYPDLADKIITNNEQIRLFRMTRNMVIQKNIAIFCAYFYIFVENRQFKQICQNHWSYNSMDQIFSKFQTVVKKLN